MNGKYKNNEKSFLASDIVNISSKPYADPGARKYQS